MALFVLSPPEMIALSGARTKNTTSYLVCSRSFTFSLPKRLAFIFIWAVSFSPLSLCPSLTLTPQHIRWKCRRTGNNNNNERWWWKLTANKTLLVKITKLPEFSYSLLLLAPSILMHLNDWEAKRGKSSPLFKFSAATCEFHMDT